MGDDKYKSKIFLLPILALVIISIILVASISAYITISMYQTYMNDEITQASEKYTQEQKNKVYNDVYLVNKLIQLEITTIEDRLKTSLKDKIQTALNVATFTYNKYKDTHNKEDIKVEISKALAVIKFYDNRAYYFMYDNKTKVLFGHPMKNFIGRDMTNYKDDRGQNLMQLDTAALEKNKIGYSKIYFNKPDNQNEQFPKITCIIKFEPLDLVLGIGEYLDVVEMQTKEYMISKLSQFDFHEKNQYITILDVHNNKGGDEFATVLLNSNRPELVGQKVSTNDKDIKGNKFKEDFLNLVMGKGKGYSEYWYQKPSTGLPAKKISYFYLQKDWNWIIASGFYYDDLEKQILIMKESITTHTRNTIYKTLVLVFLLSCIAILLAALVSFKIDKTINKYTTKIIDYEKNVREQEFKLLQQSKHESMGEMIGNIAHQWRQPLSIITMDANNMLLDIAMGNLDIDKSKEYAQSVINSTLYLSQTIDDFRNFMKPDREKEILNLNENIHSFLHLIEAPIKNNNIKIILEMDDNIEIVGYKNELIQCWINIVNNAKDALIEKNIDDRLIFISASLENDKAIIKIKDNAGGIPKTILPKIFEPYFTTKNKSQGTGLGLHMSYNLIVKGILSLIHI